MYSTEGIQLQFCPIIGNLSYPLLTLRRGEQVAVRMYWPQGDQVTWVVSGHSVSPSTFRVLIFHTWLVERYQYILNTLTFSNT